MAFEGTLWDIPLADIVQLIGLQRKTGVLALEGPDDRVTLYFEEGMVVGARSRRSPLEERMPRLLRLRGLAEDGALAEAERARGEAGESLKTTLVRRGLVSEEAWREILTLEVQDSFARVLQWREGNYRFEARSAVDAGDARIPPLEAAELLLEGFRRLDEWPMIAYHVPRPDAVLVLARPAAEIDLNHLSAGERRIVELLERGLRGPDLVDASGLGEFHACKVLAALAEAGIVAPAPEPGAPSASAPPRPAPRRAPPATTPWIVWPALAAWLVVNAAVFRPWAGVTGPPVADPLKQIRARADLAALVTQLDQYFAEVGSYPGELGALVRRGMVSSNALVDPWGRPYRYEVQGTHYRLESDGLSASPDGAAGPPAAARRRPPPA